jgi:predicted glycosyltransferase
MKNSKRILVSPLDWGLGHATRCVPIIRSLLGKGAEVVVASSGRAAFFLRQEFPGLQHVDLPDYNVRYADRGRLAWKILHQSPRLLRTISSEHRVLDDMIGQYGLHAVISDNRFGMWSGRIPSIYITHQLGVRSLAGIWFSGPFISKMHRRFIRHFDECWIPDDENQGGLSGELSHGQACPVPAFFIGPLSRFNPPTSGHQTNRHEVMAMISGPEPQRSIFETIVLKGLREAGLRSLVLLGKPEEEQVRSLEDNITILTHSSTAEMQEALLTSELVLCRSGYSSIMDLAVLGCRAVLVPTPGQTEQEYLAGYHQQKHHYYTMSQAEFDIQGLLQASRNYPGLHHHGERGSLDKRLDVLLGRL